MIDTHRHPSAPLVYVDTSDVREGALEELKGAVAELAEFVETNVPRIVAYSAFFSDDGRQMTVVHVHADAASLDQHMEVGGPEFGKFSELLTLKSIHVYGEASDKAIELMRDKVRMLGSGDVTVHHPHAGFIRVEVD